MTKPQKQTIIALICAVLAVLAVFAYTASVKSEATTQRSAAIKRYGGEKTEVVVASRDISIGTQLCEDNIKQVEWLVDLLPSGEVATQLDQVNGRVAQTDIKKNEPVLLERVGDGSSRISVPDGLEAVSVESDDVLAVGGAIKAGSLVDVYVETSQSKIVLLGHNILVLETNGGDAKASDKDSITWVTLAVTSSSTKDLLSASVKGTIHLVLPSSTVAQEKK